MDALQHAHPFLHDLDDVFDRQMRVAVDRLGCDRILTGQGGDAIFMQPRSRVASANAAAAVERYRRQSDQRRADARPGCHA